MFFLPSSFIWSTTDVRLDRIHNPRLFFERHGDNNGNITNNSGANTRHSRERNNNTNCTQTYVYTVNWSRVYRLGTVSRRQSLYWGTWTGFSERPTSTPQTWFSGTCSILYLANTFSSTVRFEIQCQMRQVRVTDIKKMFFFIYRVFWN